jgi:hypothetical protein
LCGFDKRRQIIRTDISIKKLLLLLRMIEVVAKLISYQILPPKRSEHSDYRTVSPYWVLLVYVELIRAVWADDGGQATIILTK